MINTYLTDTINIIPILTDINGAIEEAPAVESICRVKYEVKTVKSDTGQEIQSTAVLMLPAETTLDNNYKIQVTKIRGEAAPEPTKKYVVIKKGFGHGFSTAQSWLKVWIA